MSRSWNDPWRRDGRQRPGKVSAVRCPSGKTGWSQPEASRRLTKYAEQPGSRQRTPQRIYKCQLCDHWHLTSKPDKRAA